MAKFHVGALLNPDEDVLLYERAGDHQPSFDPDSALETLTLDDEGYVEIDGDEGETFWLFQQTGEVDGIAIGQQVAITLPDPDAEPLPPQRGDDPQAKIADDEAARDASHEQEMTVINPREQEALKQEGIAAEQEPPEPELTLDEMTKDELLDEADRRGVAANASMTKGEIKDAIEAG